MPEPAYYIAPAVAVRHSVWKIELLLHRRPDEIPKLGSYAVKHGYVVIDRQGQQWNPRRKPISVFRAEMQKLR